MRKFAMTEMGRNARMVAALLALPALVALVYWPGLDGTFIFDDFPALVTNQHLHIERLELIGLWHAASSFDPGGTGRQLAMASFAVNHALSGLEPWGWKLSGLLVHITNAILVNFLCVRLLALAGVKQHLHLSAAGLALAWAVHPLQVSTVLYVVQRMETLCLTFTLLALLAYLRGRTLQIRGQRGWHWLAACAPLLLLALGAKESALLFPLFTLALELSFFGFEGATQKQRRICRWGYAIGCMLGLIVFVTAVIPNYATTDAYAIRDYDALDRILSQLRILPMYLGQIILPAPSGMAFYYDDFPASKSLLQPWTTLAGGLLLTTLVGLALWLRERAPLAALGIFWFFAAHAITSNVVPLELVFEHRNYFALLGVLLALAEGVRRIPGRDDPRLKIAGAVAVIALVAFLGALRAATWGNYPLLVMEHANLAPHSARAAQDQAILYNKLANGSANSPFFTLAVSELERESAMPHASILGEQSLILLHAEHGLPVKDVWWARLNKRLRERPIGHETTGALFHLLDRRRAGIKMNDQKLGEALVTLLELKELPPFSYGAVALHALEYRRDEELAKQLLQRAIEAPDHPGYLDHLYAELVSGGFSDAAEWLEQERFDSRATVH